MSGEIQEGLSSLKATGTFNYKAVLWLLFTLALTSTYSTTQAAFYILLLIFIIDIFKKRVNSFPPPLYTRVFVVFTAYFLIATVFSIDFISALKARNIPIHLMIVYIVGNEKFSRRFFSWILYVFFFGCTVSSIYAVIQKISGISRVTGFFGDYQTLAGILSVCILILSSCILNMKPVKKRVVSLMAVILLINMTALYFTFTRSALIGLIFGLVVLFYIRAKWTLFVFISIVFLLLGISLHSPKSEIGDLVLSIMFPRDRASSRFIVNRDRIDMYGDSLKIVKKHPLTGIGYETLDIVYHDPEWDLEASKQYTRISSNYFNVLVSSGIPGFLTYMIYIGATLYLLVRALGALKGSVYYSFSAGVAASMVFTMTAGLFEPVFFDPKIRFLMYYFIGLVFLFYCREAKEKDQLHAGDRIKPQ